jgi:AraC-like DNA-binding protein
MSGPSTAEHLLEAIRKVANQLKVAAPARLTSKGEGSIDQVLGAIEALLPHSEAAPPLGLLIAQNLSIPALGELGLAMRASEALGDALERLVRFHRLRAPFVDLSLDPIEDATRLLLRYRLPPRPCLQVVEEGGLAMLVHLGRGICGRRWTPKAVYFSHAVVRRGAWESFFGAPVYQGSVASLELTRDVLALPTIAPDAVVAEVLDRSAEHTISDLADAPLSASLQQWLVEHLSRAPRVTDAAKAMGMSRRTLHRHLREEGTHYKALYDQTGSEQAERLLQSDTPVSEIAAALGFSDASSFCRAYRRWTGRTPGASRSSKE